MNPNFTGESDSECVKDPSRHSVDGWTCHLEGTPINMASKMMPVMALSVTEAELHAAVQCVQDVMFAMRFMMSIGLKVKLPMSSEVDDEGAVDTCNNWTVGGRTQHVEVKQHSLWELKESGILKIQWKSGKEMTSDLFTKNLGGSLFEKHALEFAGKDEHCHESKKKQLDRKANLDERAKNDETSLPAIKQRCEEEHSKIWNELAGD